jgi:Domain of unknown function (DUF1992)
MFTLLAERKIAEAIANGELDNLPGAGRPLELDDDSLIPEDLRAAYRILKNAGYIPPEVQTLNQIGELERLVNEAPDTDARKRILRKLALLRMAAEARPDRRRARTRRLRG